MRSLISVLLIVATLPAAAPAQASSSGLTAALRASDIQRGTLVRIETDEGRRYGYWRDPRGDSLVLEDGAMRLTTIPVAEVRQIEVGVFRAGRASRAGGLIGAGAGIAAGLAVAATQRPCDWCIPTPWLAGAGLLSGIAVGAVGGFVAGHVRRTWIRVYPQEHAFSSVSRARRRLDFGFQERWPRG